ncbi:MAG: tetratricopeptide repeat protein [Saprospiraceae bacterium]|nr:tetratricopeptide repeat protein [Saprospiraceae bacterium]
MKCTNHLCSLFLFVCSFIALSSSAQEAGDNLSKMSLDVLEEKANSLQKSGKIKNSLPYVKAALKRKQAIGTDREYALALSDLGYLYERILDYDNAKISYTQASLILEKIVSEDDPDYVQLQSNLQSLDLLKHSKRGETFPSKSNVRLSSQESTKESGNQGWVWLLVIEVGILIIVAIMVQRYRYKKQNED